jgi:hypothetical protein
VDLEGLFPQWYGIVVLEYFLLGAGMDSDQSRRMYVLIVRETAVDLVSLAVPHTNWDRRIYSPVTSLWHHFI